MTNVTIATFPIRLGQFLKLAEIAQDGLHAKMLILEGMVSVNGEKETRRGKQLFPGDIVMVNGQSFIATKEHADCMVNPSS